MAIHAGSWFGLPDLGITEKVGSLLGAPRTAQGGSNISSVVTGRAASPEPVSYGPPYQGPKTTNITGSTGSQSGQVLGATSSLGGTNNNSLESNIISPNQSFGGGAPSEMDVINQQFNDFNNYLSQQEQSAQTNFNDTKGLYDTQKTNAETQYGTERATQNEATSKQGALDLAKVRQLLGDLSQRNAAQTSITGGGSVSEALGERFGRQAQQGLGNVMSQTQQAIQRTNQFYDNAIAKLNETYNANILQAKQTLDDNLSQIRGARVQSASAKQQSSLEAWRNYYNNVNQAKIQAASFKAQYDMWKQQQDSALSSTQGFNLSNQDMFNQGVQPSLSMGSQGQIQQPKQTAMNPYYQFSNGLSEEEKQRQLMSTGMPA